MIAGAMKIIAVHNFYQQAGGEDEVFRAEARILRAAGHTVREWSESNDRVEELSRAELAKATVWNSGSYKRMNELVREERADVVHFHNTLPLISPAAYYAASRAGAAVVQTLHNYRLICPAATLFRDGHPCEDCVGRLPWPGVLHACYRDSAGASAAVAAMLAFHRTRGTWREQVDAYVVLTEFARAKFIAGGLPEGKLHLKPNFVDPDPGCGTGGNTLLFAGRLTPVKGIEVLLKAWQGRSDLPPLRIAGDGEMADEVRAAASTSPNVEYIGQVSHERVIREMQTAMALVQPSVWYEMFPVNVAEAFACGLPVVASDAGTLPEIVKNGTCGLIFRSGDAADLARNVLDLCAKPQTYQHFRAAARSEFERYYRGDRNAERLVEIYRQALRNRANRNS